MNRTQKYYPFVLSAMLMWIVLYIIYPHYQYYIDPDGTAYLTISKRYASGDIQRAINGYWSPWACWLTAGLIKTGMAAIPASVVINALGATGFLYISQSFFLRFTLTRKMQWMLNMTLALFLCYAIFWQSFDDLWECFFLLTTLRLMLAEGYERKPALWIVCGLTGALAYFAKAYSFPFFILNTVCCGWLIAGGSKLRWLKMCATSVVAMVLVSMPWILALHGKYGIWTTSTSGSLNMSWYLVGHPHWKPDIHLLLPPAYPDSPYYWEDPWFANGDTPHFWDSWSLFENQIIRAAWHFVLFLSSTLQLSLFFPFIFFAGLVSVFAKKARMVISGDLKVLLLSCLLFPLGYLPINFEPRYLWYMVPLTMVLGAYFLTHRPVQFKIPYPVFTVLFPVSFLIFPAIGMWRMYDAGKDEFQFAEKLKSAGIHGSFTGNISHLFLERVAYFSGNQYYFLLPFSDGRTRTNGLSEELERYKINYYFHYSVQEPGKRMNAVELCGDSTLLVENMKSMEVVKPDVDARIVVYRMAPQP